jgi:hypothetical protein
MDDITADNQKADITGDSQNADIAGDNQNTNIAGDNQFTDIALFLPDIRILASNKQVYQGGNNKAAMDDYLFAAGRCMAGYIRNHARRVHKYSDVDVTEFAVYTDGCPISEEDVIDGLNELIKKIYKNSKRVK